MAPDYTNLSSSFFAANAHKFDLAEPEECGRYTEEFVKHARKIDPKIGHLKKKSGTQYNGHAIDAVLYPVGNGVYHSIDLIGNAEQKHPWKSEGGINYDPRPTWNEYMGHAYSAADWTAEPIPAEAPKPKFNFPGYEDLGGDNTARELLGQAMLADWREAGRVEDAPHKPVSERRVVIDDGFVVWNNRILYDTFADILLHGKTGTEAMRHNINKHRPEWRKGLGL